MPLLTRADLDSKTPEDYNEKLRCIELASGLLPLYHDYIANDRTETYSYNVTIFGEKTRSAGIHASEISSCHRKVVYSLLGTEGKPDVENANVNMHMRFRLGHAVHAMLQNDWHRIAANNVNIKFEDEVKISPALGGVALELDLHSSCDGVITILQDDIPQVRVGMEIKTEADKGYSSLKAPRPYHLEQTCIYMAALDLPLMWTLYYNKSNSNIIPSISPFLFQFDWDLWEEIEMSCTRILHLAGLKQLPERTEGMHCDWCPDSYTCKPYILAKRTTNKPRNPGMGMTGIRRKP